MTSLRPRDECGVVGVWGVSGAAKIAALCLQALQHRGQESAGIVTLDHGRLVGRRGLGLVADVFDAAALDALPGEAAIGHVRYSTTGASTLENAQPLQIEYRRGALAIAHNGNLVNAAALREGLEAQGAIFRTTVDTETILHLLARQAGPFEEALVESLAAVQGAYAAVLLTDREMVGVRDPLGFRPLVVGRIGTGWVVASETCALDIIDARYERDVEPGEALFFDPSGGLRSVRLRGSGEPPRLCVFELIYFSRPDSSVFGRSVHLARTALGEALAEHHPAEADVVIAVPDSSNAAAAGYARRSGLPLEIGLIRSHYVGRTFIEPDRSIRDLRARVKYNPVRPVLEGRRVVVVDDSIVRGTTSRRLVRLLRDAGAREVHMRIACPPWRFPCNYGIDTPGTDDLIAHAHSVDEIRRSIGLDSLAYLSIEEMLSALGGSGFCTACFDGRYPVPFDVRAPKDVLVPRHRREDVETPT